MRSAMQVFAAYRVCCDCQWVVTGCPSHQTATDAINRQPIRQQLLSQQHTTPHACHNDTQAGCIQGAAAGHWALPNAAHT
jgi:hypothetical protein